jgi:hypothetical protein
MTHSAETLRQDSAQTFRGSALILDATPNLFKARAYRAYREFTTTTILRLVATTPFLLTVQKLYVDTGAAKATITVGSTPTGTFAALPTKFSKNGVLTPQPTATTTVDVLTGTIAGGTEREVIRVNSGAGAGAASELVGVRYLPANTYWINIVVTGSTSGVYAIEYEEVDP